MRVLALLMLVVLNCIGCAEDSTVFSASRETAFLPDRVDKGLKWLWAYGQFPASTNGLEDPTLKANVAKWFREEWGNYLKPDLLPGQQFVLENLKLIPAEKMQQLVGSDGSHFSPTEAQQFKEDVFFLRFRVAQRDYLIAQTSERFMMFVGITETSSNEWVSISEVVARGISTRGIAFLQLGNGGCLLINKGLNASNRPPNYKPPDRWFEAMGRASGVPEKDKGKQAEQ